MESTDSVTAVQTPMQEEALTMDDVRSSRPEPLDHLPILGKDEGGRIESVRPPPTHNLSPLESLGSRPNGQVDVVSQ